VKLRCLDRSTGKPTSNSQIKHVKAYDELQFSSVYSCRISFKHLTGRKRVSEHSVLRWCAVTKAQAFHPTGWRLFPTEHIHFSNSGYIFKPYLNNFRPYFSLIIYPQFRSSSPSRNEGKIIKSAFETRWHFLLSVRPFIQAQKAFISEFSSHISGLASAWLRYFRYGNGVYEMQVFS
jgi:hypothetical protein